ncbi:MAG TPA: rod shape-determining protein MreC [Candidatus Binatia bacterium]|nr:rod shape-determining protein MreC [Candidatus Binatia bacterium]
MIEFLRRNLVLLVSGLFLVLAAALVIRTGGETVRSDRLGQVFVEVLSLPQRPVAALNRALWHAERSVVDLFRARQEVVALRARVRTLEQDTARLGELEQENARLHALVDLRETLRGNVVAAHVVGRDAGTLSRTLVIDRGERDGVAKGAAVLAPSGVVGHVFLAAPDAARVLLITDHNSGVDAVVQRTRARGIVEGQVDGGCMLKFVKRTEDVQVGDLIVTSGVDGIFPKGLPVGRVTAVDKRGQGLFQSVEVTPAVDPSALEEVLVARGPIEVAPTPAPGS